MTTRHAGQKNGVHSAAVVRKICLNAGADDVGLVDIDRDSMEKERNGSLHVYSLTRSIIAFVTANNRENIQSPARYVANEEFHHTGDRISGIAREILRRLNRIGIRGVVVNKGWPMVVDRVPGKIWDVSHKIMAVEAGLGHMGVNRLVLHPKFGSCVQLESILADGVFDKYERPLDSNPCMECNLCTAVCPTGATAKNRPFDLTALMKFQRRAAHPAVQD